MARDFFDEFDTAKRAFEEASDATGVDLKAICFEEDPRLDLTEFTQPAILTAEIAMFRVLCESFGFQSSLFAGHSLGEYTALVAAGVIPFVDAVQIVRKRGALMQEAVPAGVGKMAAIILPEIETSGVGEIVKNHGAELANLNSLEQYVISGKSDAVEKAVAELNDRFAESQIFTVMLNVSAPFHSSLMKGIEAEFEGYLRTFESHFDLNRSSNVLSNFTAAFHTPQGLVENLVRQISGSVQWIENMRLLISRSGTIYEVGPNRPLGKFFKTLGADVTSVINLRSAKKAFAES